MNSLVIASHNPGKVKEIGELLAPFRINAFSAAELGLSEPEETGKTFAENAALKARAAAQASGKMALADDSGLCIEALGGAPGIYSARWAGKKKDFAAAQQRIHSEFAAKNVQASGAKAHFICALALAAPNGKTEVFEGRVDGTLTFPPRGTKGFGYDPIFIPQGDNKTFGEIDANDKHAISHRARAFAKFTAYLQAQKEAV